MIENIFEVIILILINASSIFLIIVVLANSFKDQMYRWFVVMTLLLIGWVDFAYIGYSEYNSEISLLAYRLNLAFVSLFFAAIYVFYVECFLRIRKPRLKYIIFLVSSVFVFLSIFTDTIIESVLRRSWGNEINFGPANDAFNLYALIVTGILVYYFISRYLQLPSEEKKKVIYFLIGTFFLVVLNVVFNILSPAILGTAEYQHFGDYSAVIFLGFTAFAMIKRQFLDIKIALTAFLITVIGILLLVDIFFLSNDAFEQIIKSVIFLFYLLISLILVRSVVSEIKQRERFEVVNKELEKTTDALEIELKNLEIAKKQIEDALKKEKDMMDILGHELRTPLTVVRNAVLMIDMEFQKPQPDMTAVNDLLEKAKENIKREISTLQTVLSTTRLENDRAQINNVKVDAKDVVHDSIEALGREAEKKKLQIKTELPEKEIFLWAGREQTQEIMDNLLSNAIKYTEKGEITISIIEEGDYVSIRVKDTGEGIPDNEIKNLGKKFHRVNPYVQSNGGEADMNVVRPGGTGIGLYVVKGFLEKMGGKFGVESKLGEGSIFTASLQRYTGQDLSAKTDKNV